jgi:uncharacterized glyoxalase superfamily protein PhnB
MATDAARVIDFLRDAFAGEETRRELRSDGKVSHAEVRVSGATIMVGELGTDWEPLCAAVYLYVADLDAAHRRAVATGAVSYMAPTVLPGGDRMAAVRDPFGNVWWLVNHGGAASAAA